MGWGGGGGGGGGGRRGGGGGGEIAGYKSWVEDPSLIEFFSTSFLFYFIFLKRVPVKEEKIGGHEAYFFFVWGRVGWGWLGERLRVRVRVRVRVMVRVMIRGKGFIED